MVTGRIVGINTLSRLHMVAVETLNGTVEILVPYHFPVQQLKQDTRLKVLRVACEGLARYKLLEVLSGGYWKEYSALHPKKYQLRKLDFYLIIC